MSDLRQDPVSSDWIIMAPERGKRPHAFFPKKRRRRPTPKSICPFEDLRASGNWPPIAAFPNERGWEMVIVPNKYPALRHDIGCATLLAEGPYQFMTGAGHHELLITRDHERHIAHVSLEEGIRTIHFLQKRYRELERDKCLLYVSTFFNWGPSAGATLYHPHFQILALPIVPPDVGHSLAGSRAYFEKNRRCVHCDTIRYEEKTKRRIIEKNDSAVLLAPFVSRQPFEIRIFPRRHMPFFEHTSPRDIRGVVALLRSSLRRIEKYLRDPDLNFFIHTAPLRPKNRYKHYHWHIEILPKITIPAGFELSTGVEINVIHPDNAAAILRGKP